MARKSIVAAAALASLAVVCVPAVASAKKDSFNGSGIKIEVKPRIKTDLGLHVRCRREPAINELGVRFTRHTNCVLW
jgi:hypothetical protein